MRSPSSPTAAVLLVLTVLNRLTGRIHPFVYRRLIVIHTAEDAQGATDRISAILSDEGCRVLDLASGHDRSSGEHELVFYMALKNDLQSPRVTERVSELDGVESARWKLISTPR